MTIPNVLAAANTILAAIIFFQVLYVLRRDKSNPISWLRYLQIFVSVLWTLVSFYLLITPEDATQAEIGRIITRPLVTFTLAIMASSSIIRSKGIRK